MWQLLLHHARPSLRRRLVGRLAGFILGGGAPGMASELSIIATHAASAAPRETLRVLLLPLLRKLEADVAELPRVPPPVAVAGAAAGVAAAPPPSATAVAALRYRVTLLAGCMGELHADHVMLPYIDQALAAAVGGGAAPPPPPPSAPSPPPSAAVAALPAGSLAARVAALAESLLCVNSGVLQSEGGGLCGNLVMMLTR